MEKKSRLSGLWKGDNSSFVKYAVFITAAFFIYIVFISDDNLVRLVRSEVEYRRQLTRIEECRQELKILDDKIKMLSTDRDTLEEVARERFHFAAPGDDVYLLDRD
ncbi:MAG: septum formation initiator family protein [Candidatus Cryptobacteroides sp.]